MVININDLAVGVTNTISRGGLEMLFADQRKHTLTVSAKDEEGKPVTVGWLVNYLCEKVMKDSRKEMFVLDGHV